MSAQYKCAADGCNKERHSDTNHWLILWEGTISGCEVKALTMAQWSEELAAMEGVKLACGSNHASILIARWDSTGSLVEQKSG